MMHRLILLLFLLLTSRVNSQPASLPEMVNNENAGAWADYPHAAQIRAFYSSRLFRLAWMDEAGQANRNEFFSTLEQAEFYGLNREDYSLPLINALLNRSWTGNALDSLNAELQITELAMHFYSDLAIGNTVPPLSYRGLKYTPSCYDIPFLVSTYADNRLLGQLPAVLEAPFAEIKKIRSEIQRMRAVMDDSSFREEKIVSTVAGRSNEPLCRKLTYLGLLPVEGLPLTDSLVKAKVREAQKEFNLLSDGTLRSTALAELNLPLATRLSRLKLSLNYYRWLYCLTLKQSVIVVNIPAAYLKVYNQGNVSLAMKLIVGKPATPTPTLSSMVAEVILYPYWIVPSSIVTKEVLPKLRRNPGYIDANNFQVLNKQGKVVDPYSVNWEAISGESIPYVIRQSTGCDNALGLIKLNFFNPYTVYLHDTPGKGLFQTNKRFYSHGCMRMEKPAELAHLVLKNHRNAIDTLDELGCLRNKAPVVVPADEKLPVIVWYNPVGLDSKGNLVFFEDIYKNFK